jgi:hypothetical protein
VLLLLLLVDPLLLLEVEPLLLVEPPLLLDEVEPLLDVDDDEPVSVAGSSFVASPGCFSMAPPQALPTADKRRTERKTEEASRRSMARVEQSACRAAFSQIRADFAAPSRATMSQRRAWCHERVDSRGGRRSG